ncbi:hypothetical protein Naga_100460g3, partial [Nannochloropsis gaditana]
MSDNPLTLFFPFLEKLMAHHRILSRKPSPCPLLLATTLLVSLALLPLAAGFLLPSLPSSPAIRQGKVTTYTLLVIWTHASGTCGYSLRIAGALTDTGKSRTGERSLAPLGRPRYLGVRVKGGTEDDDRELAAEFSRRLEDEEESLPRVPIRKSSSPSPGGGVPQKVAQRSFATMPKTQSYNKEDG